MIIEKLDQFSKFGQATSILTIISLTSQSGRYNFITTHYAVCLLVTD